MAHAQWHTQLPQYGSPGFGSAVSNRLIGQAAPPGLLSVRSRLSGMDISSPSDVSQLKGETDEERRKREEEERKKRERNKETLAAGLGGAGEAVTAMSQAPASQPYLNLGLTPQGQPYRQYGGRYRGSA